MQNRIELILKISKNLYRFIQICKLPSKSLIIRGHLKRENLEKMQKLFYLYAPKV